MKNFILICTFLICAAAIGMVYTNNNISTSSKLVKQNLEALACFKCGSSECGTGCYWHSVTCNKCKQSLMICSITGDGNECVCGNATRPCECK